MVTSGKGDHIDKELAFSFVLFSKQKYGCS